MSDDVKRLLDIALSNALSDQEQAVLQKQYEKDFSASIEKVGLEKATRIYSKVEKYYEQYMRKVVSLRATTGASVQTATATSTQEAMVDSASNTASMMSLSSTIIPKLMKASDFQGSEKAFSDMFKKSATLPHQGIF